ncbi:hypothetical protein [Bradyrhizobium sp. Rc3b]|uniref:hypothetical protein n=1 Tax=Bradyrhizobium sp. Rc3b TaxID=1855322 RepID=UPI000B8755F3|nr:hypothetical protein [Bradyrhizobium sp. Rc3b]
MNDFRAHFGDTLIGFLLTMERAIQLLAATCSAMPDTPEKRKLVDQRRDLVNKALSLRRLLGVAGLITNEPMQLVVLCNREGLFDLPAWSRRRPVTKSTAIDCAIADRCPM